MALRRGRFLACALFMMGCGGEGAGSGAGGGEACAPGDSCVPPGLPPDMPCAPGEWLRETDGACIPAGVPPDGCGEGFVHDGDGGCEPILPPAACPPGMMAVPGETSCREVAPCEPGSWGGIPDEPDTVYVDESYAGGDGDGSPAAPFTTIQAGIDAAPAGAIVAVAAGSYAEDVVVEGKPVRLWGRCPSLVEIAGTVGGEAALSIRSGASGSEVRRLGITGASMGMRVSGSDDVLASELWIHDNPGRGVQAELTIGPTSLTVDGSLIERNYVLGVYARGADVTIDATVVRDTMPDAQGNFGRGINAEPHPDTGARAHLAVARSIIESSHEYGVFVGGSDATMDATLVRDTLPDAQGLFGRGIEAAQHPATGARATLAVTRSLIDHNREIGVFVFGSDATVDATVVRDTLPDPQGGSGIAAEHADTDARASLDVVRSLVDRNHYMGVFVHGSDATVDATVVRDAVPDAQGLGGRGIVAQQHVDTDSRAWLEVERSVIERNHEVGVLVLGSDTSVGATVMRDTSSNQEGVRGRAFQLQSQPSTGALASASVMASLFERSVEAGVMVVGPATAEIDACVIRNTLANVHGFLGDGLVVVSERGTASATVTAARIEESGRAGVSSFGGAVALERTLLVCQRFDIGAETWMDQPSVLDDRGGVLCGCPEATMQCVARSYALEPPAPIDEE